jgi:hypothetical protein
MNVIIKVVTSISYASNAKKKQDNSDQLSFYCTVSITKQTGVTPLFKHSSVITVISYVRIEWLRWGLDTW